MVVSKGGFSGPWTRRTVFSELWAASCSDARRRTSVPLFLSRCAGVMLPASRPPPAADHNEEEPLGEDHLPDRSLPHHDVPALDRRRETGRAPCRERGGKD